MLQGFRARLRGGERLIGTMVTLPTAATAEILAGLGFDWLFLDAEHGPLETADVVRFARYAPEGTRGVGLARAHGYGFRFREYIASANDEIAVVVQAENVKAVENIESIVRVPGIDAVLVGPYDLAASLGKMGRVDDPSVIDAIDHLTKTCLAAGVPLGYFGVTVDAVRPYIERGYTLVVAGVDTVLLGTAAKTMLTDLRR